MNVLFTSVGRRVELMQAWQMAFKNNKITGRIFGTDIDPLAPAIQLVNKGFIVSRTDSPAYISQVFDICKNQKIDLVFPLIDPDIPVLAENKTLFDEIGTKIVVINIEQVEITADKWRTYSFFQSMGLNTPNSWLPSEKIEWDNLLYPLFIKPRSGSASINAKKVISPLHLKDLSENTENPIIQEFIDGTEITCDVICGLNGKVQSVIQRQRIETRSGEVSKGKTVFYKDVMDSCLKIGDALNAIGPITVQCIINNDTPYFIEINPRYGGGAPLGIAAGANSPEWYIKEHLGISYEVPKLGVYQTNLFMTRYDQAFFLKDEDIQRIKSNNI